MQLRNILKNNLITNFKTNQMKLENLSTTAVKQLRNMTLDLAQVLHDYEKYEYGIPETLIKELAKFNLELNKILIVRNNPNSITAQIIENENR